MHLSKRQAPWLIGATAVLVIAMIGIVAIPRIWPDEYEFHGGTYDPERPAPQLAMTDQFGNDFRLEDHRDKVVLIYFGYTFCPDFCPTTMLEVQDVLGLLGENSNHVEVVFVTVDPERDTPQKLHDYLAFFNSDFYGLSASVDETNQIKRDWNVTGEKIEPEDGEEHYLVSHTTSLFAIAPDGNYGAIWPYGMDPELIAEDIDHLIDE